MTPAQYARNTGEQVAVMESRLDTMAETQSELAQMLRDHMLREEATTKLLLDRISDIELRLSRWYGMVLGIGAIWSFLLAVIGILAAIGVFR
jgi:hypothetical protein